MDATAFSARSRLNKTCKTNKYTNKQINIQTNKQTNKQTREQYKVLGSPAAGQPRTCSLGNSPGHSIVVDACNGDEVQKKRRRGAVEVQVQV
jgi:hypothetical protein